MLGRLKMPLSGCIKAYMDMSKKAFTQRNLIDRVKAKVTLGPNFKTETLEEAIKDIIRKSNGGMDPEAARLAAPKNECKV